MVAPKAWRESGPAVEASIANVPWWDLFQDQQLRTLINLALKENSDLKIAVERIERDAAAIERASGKLRAEDGGRADCGQTWIGGNQDRAI